MSSESGILRRFNGAGITEFVWRIETLRAGGEAAIDDTFVTDAKLTEPIVPEVLMERPAFATKRDAGAYLSERTRAARALHGNDDRGLWTWLSAWHWNAVCPVRETGSRRILAPYSYVFGHLFEKRKTQHLLAVAVTLYEQAASSKLLLDTPVYSLTSLVEQVSTRLAMTRIRGFFDLLDILYLDPKTGKAKAGVVDAKFVRLGDLRHRLPARIRQLEVTHDLTDLTAEQLLNLLGDEFRQWAITPTEPSAAARHPTRRAVAPLPLPTSRNKS